MGAAANRLAHTALVILAMIVVAAWGGSVAPAAVGTAQTSKADKPLQIVYESAEYNAETNTVDFTVQFNRPPNFRTVDEFGRMTDSFQYFVVGDVSQPYPQNFDAIVRGDELQFRQRLLPIRNSAPADSDPGAGGWGTIRATVPFQLHGRVLSFSASLDSLTDHSSDGRFTYILETYNFGALVESRVSESRVAE